METIKKWLDDGKDIDVRYTCNGVFILLLGVQRIDNRSGKYHIAGDNSILSLDIQDVEVARDRVIVRTTQGGKAVFQESDLI